MSFVHQSNLDLVVEKDVAHPPGLRGQEPQFFCDMPAIRYITISFNIRSTACIFGENVPFFIGNG